MFVYIKDYGTVKGLRVIYPEKSRTSALILGLILVTGASRAFGEDPNIGKSTNSLVFTEVGNSKTFEIWNAGTGTLYYKLSIDGNDADYFIIDGTIGDVNGNSTGADNKKMHIVNMDYDQWPDTVLNARIVITDTNDANNVSYITLQTEVSDDANTPDNDPEIGLSTRRIALAGKVLSKKFQVWNKGTGTLSYTLTIDGNDADNFTIDEDEGDSNGVNDKQTHTVTVSYDDDFHNDTLYAWIEITDDNDNSAYIDLSATETIATRVSYIAIEQGKDYGLPGEGDDINDFLLYIDTDDTVAEITFITPEGKEYSISDVIENDDANVLYWTYLDDDANLPDHGDGEYIIEVNYTNGDTAHTVVNFGVPNKPGTIVWPTQTPALINPEFDEQTVSPVRFEWEKCVDPNVNGIRLILTNEVSEIRIVKDYSKSTTKPSAIDLEIGEWALALNFGRRYQSDKGNDDGIEYEVGKWSRSDSNFEIMKWFGTFGEFKNHPLKIADCSGTEVTFNISGGGKGEIDSDDCGFDSIILTDTTEKSVFTIKTADGNVTTIGSIEADGDMKTITGRKVNIEGGIDVSAGGVRSIVLNNVSGSINIGEYEIDDESPKTITCALNFNQADELAMDSYTPIRNLRAMHWTGGSLTAPWISSMTIKGDFGANLTLSGDNPKTMTLKSAKIAGEISGVWSIQDGNCGSITCASSTDDFEAIIAGAVKTIKAAGNTKTGIPAVLSGTWQFGAVKTITAAEIEQCNITAVADGNIGSISAGAIKDSSFSTAGSIAKIENKGIKNQAFCFINSKIEADHIGIAYLSYLKYINGGVDFGLTTYSIDKLTLKDSNRKTTWLDPNLSTDPIIIDDFKITLPP